MIQATVRMRIAPHRRNEVLEVLIPLAERARIQPGCLSFRIYHDEQQEGVFLSEALWQGEEELKQYLRSENYSLVLQTAELALEPPEIQFKTISHVAGLEIVEEARGIMKNDHG